MDKTDYIAAGQDAFAELNRKLLEEMRKPDPNEEPELDEEDIAWQEELQRRAEEDKQLIFYTPSTVISDPLVIKPEWIPRLKKFKRYLLKRRGEDGYDVLSPQYVLPILPKWKLKAYASPMFATIPEASEITGICMETIRHWSYDGVIEAFPYPTQTQTNDYTEPVEKKGGLIWFVPITQCLVIIGIITDLEDEFDSGKGVELRERLQKSYSEDKWQKVYQRIRKAHINLQLKDRLLNANIEEELELYPEFLQEHKRYLDIINGVEA